MISPFSPVACRALWLSSVDKEFALAYCDLEVVSGVAVQCLADENQHAVSMPWSVWGGEGISHRWCRQSLADASAITLLLPELQKTAFPPRLPLLPLLSPLSRSGAYSVCGSMIKEPVYIPIKAPLSAVNYFKTCGQLRKWATNICIYVASGHGKSVAVLGRAQTVLLFITEGGLWLDLCQGKAFHCSMRTSWRVVECRLYPLLQCW